MEPIRMIAIIPKPSCLSMNSGHPSLKGPKAVSFWTRNMSLPPKRNLCMELTSLKKKSIEEMCQQVYANYGAFIRTSQELSELEGEIVDMRTLLSKQASLVHGVVDAVQLDFIFNELDIASESSQLLEDNQTLSQDFQLIIENLDVLIAERRFDEALCALSDGEDLILGMSEDDETFITHSQTLLSKRKINLIHQLIDVVEQPSASRHEVHTAILNLCKLGDSVHAHSLLLNVYKQKLHSNIQGLHTLPSCYGGTYTYTLSQCVFSALSQATKDFQRLFSEEGNYASGLILWVSDELAAYASLVEKHVLQAASATGCLHAAVECVQTALNYCSLLEDDGLVLRPTLLKLLQPSVEKTLNARVLHIKDSIAAIASVDGWEASLPSGLVNQQSTGGYLTDIKLSKSAQMFQKMLQDFFEDAVPLSNMQLGGLLLDNCSYLLEYYTDILSKAIPKPRFEASSNSKDTVLAETEHQQLCLWSNVSAFAEVILPREEARKRAQTTGTSVRGIESREWKRKLQRSVDSLRNTYCRNQVLDLFFNEEGLPNFTADTYLLLEDDIDMSQAMPSPLFQELFLKLNKLNQVAGNILEGRERTTASLLSKFLEVFLIFILEDQDFWEGMRDGSKPLGKVGLQQCLLDMHFIMQMATQGHYSTRKITAVVQEIYNQAVESYQGEGTDPYDFLPENEWFMEATARCIEVLSLKSKGQNL
ncbi:hypothetical protein KP509_27G052400 [Ceratopteris richardii]|uniref:Exocyst component Exo84 C-terminal domain-containing protein n=1 Tax=Ceratopteris richardii TaxID=49495 RepID=A0A8T2RI47_CERRI|nr:hypothetical protein KP509_27G052400 [Ceratopteris richardii]